MDELFTLHPGGLFLRREALDLGYHDRDLQAGLRQRLITRVRHGAYAPVSVWEKSDLTARYRLRCRAVLLSHEERVALSHTSAAIMHGLRLWEPDLRHVHVVRLDGAQGRRHGDVVYHEEPWRADDIFALDEMLLVDPVDAALGAASLTGVEGGVVVLDSLYDADLGTPDQACRAYERRAQWPYSRSLQVVVRLARPGSESVGESRSRVLFYVHSLPQPVLQYEVRDTDGRLIGRTDFAWPERRALGEFDGRSKYGRLLGPDDDVREVVYREKLREDALREATGFTMIRLVYGDLYVPRATAARIRRTLSHAR